LVSRFYAVWTDDDLAAHKRAAEVIAQVAKDAFAFAGERARTKQPAAEHEMMAWIKDRFTRANLETDHGPNVSFGANAANPHYEPSAATPMPITEGSLLLIDLWATERGRSGPYADQTWMASVGAPADEATRVWTTVRDARDAAIKLVQDAAAKGEKIRGAAADDAAR
jgi:Xaa-Pro aminopeptidase